jgi:serine/threonine-protein kinase
VTPFGSAHLVLAGIAALLALGHVALFATVRKPVDAVTAFVFFSFALTDYGFAFHSSWGSLQPNASLSACMVMLATFGFDVIGLPMVPWLLFDRQFTTGRKAFLFVILLAVLARSAAVATKVMSGERVTLDQMWNGAVFTTAYLSAAVVIAMPLEWLVEVVLASRRGADPLLTALTGASALMGLLTGMHALLVVMGVIHQPVFLGLGGLFFLFAVSGYLGRSYIRSTRRATGIGGYEIIEPLGKGGMGETFVAVRQGVEGFSRKVVLKKMHGGADQTDRARFLSEAKLAASLRHPNIVDVLDLGELDGGDLFIAMDFIDGATVSELARAAQKQEVALPPQVVAAIGVQLCKGLAHAHKSGVLHRDIKRANVMVSVDGVVKLIDFGLAQRPLPPGTKADPNMAGLAKLSSGLTANSTVIGTPGYLAPERLRGEAASAASDLFAVGVVLYELLAGHRPFEALDGEEDVQAVLDGRHRPLGEIRRDVPQKLVELVESCLAVDASKRPADAAVLGHGLATALDVGAVDLGEWVTRLRGADGSSLVPTATPRSKEARAEAKTTPQR